MLYSLTPALGETDNIASQTILYCLSPKSVMTLLSLTNDTETKKNCVVRKVCQFHQGFRVVSEEETSYS